MGRELRGDDLLGSERISLKTTSEDAGWRTENLLGKVEVGDEAGGFGDWFMNFSDL